VRAASIGLILVALMLVWAAHDGGFDADTWYWGALLALSLLALVIGSGMGVWGRSRAMSAAVALFGLYVAWSYLSIAWASAPGVALDGSNRALLYLIVFALAAALPWTVEGVVAALLTFAVGVGVIGVVLLVRLASADHVSALLSAGRMNAPTGYYNATAALFWMDALVCVGLAARRELPGLLRGLLVAFAGSSLQMAILGQSRGWLFTLPIVVVLVAVVARDRLRLAAVAVIPVVVALLPVHRLLRIYDSAYSPALNGIAGRAGQAALVLFGVAFILGTLLAWADQVRHGSLGPQARRWVGGVVLGAVIAGGCVGAVVVSHGSPFSFIARQWHGFSHPQETDTVSHFADVGSGRYDFWRVALDAFAAHPIGGLGQDNFADYYLPRRRTSEEPEWTHSLELRLLTHTGIVGFGLFAAFLMTGLVAVLRARRRAPPLASATAAVALMPLIVWVVYGSVDWFWELPALAGPALGFFGMAMALEPVTVAAETDSSAAADGGVAVDATAEGPARTRRRRLAPSRLVSGGLLAAALMAAAVVLAFPYLSVRETSIADDIQSQNPQAALRHLADAAKLNPLNPIPGRLAGALALTIGDTRTADQRFRQSISREPGGWFAWLGAGLAASALGHPAQARRDFERAYAINSRQPAVREALRRVDTAHPLTSEKAFGLLVSE